MSLLITGVLLGFLIGIGLKTIIDCFDKRDIFLSRLDSIEEIVETIEEDIAVHSDRFDNLIERVDGLVDRDSNSDDESDDTDYLNGMTPVEVHVRFLEIANAYADQCKAFPSLEESDLDTFISDLSDDFGFTDVPADSKPSPAEVAESVEMLKAPVDPGLSDLQQLIDFHAGTLGYQSVIASLKPLAVPGELPAVEPPKPAPFGDYHRFIRPSGPAGISVTSIGPNHPESMADYAKSME